MHVITKVLLMLFAGSLLYIGFGLLLVLWDLHRAVREYERYLAEVHEQSAEGPPQQRSGAAIYSVIV